MHRFIVLDFETTGNSPREDDIIQIGAVTIDDGHITNRFSTFVKPGKPIPEFISNLTGITDEMVASAPALEDVLPTLLRLLDNRVFVAHNAMFDLAFLQEALHRQGYFPYDGYVLDTVELARFLLPTQGSYRLVELADDFNIPHSHPHRADCDAEATAHLFLLLLQKLRALPLVTIQQLLILVQSYRSDMTTLLQHIETEKLMQSAGEDHSFDDMISEQNDWDIYRQVALKRRNLHPVPEERNEEEDVLLTMDQLLEQVTGREGGLSSLLPSYQSRPSQEVMMREVHQAMEEGCHLLVEAGTGTGKSLGYLIPALFFAHRHQEKVVVSTHTIHLQEQLFHKDIPLLQQALPFSFTTATLKGRGNYLCLRKMEHSLHDSLAGSQEQVLARAQLVTWLTQTDSGDVEELNLPPAGQLLWQQVKSDTQSCLHRNCPWFSRCYYFQARERARQADLIIVNHSLLISDLVAENRVLPSHQVVVVDEAHQLEEVANQNLGLHLSSSQLLYLLERFSVDHPKDTLCQFHEEVLFSYPDLRQETTGIMKNIQLLQDEARNQAQSWTQTVYQWAAKRQKGASVIDQGGLRYEIAMFAEDKRGIPVKTRDVMDAIGALAQTIDEFLKLVQDQGELTYPLRSLITNLNGMLDEAKQLMERLHHLFLSFDSRYVYWMETESRTARKHVHVYSAPLDVADVLADKLFRPKRSVIMTSATLTTKPDDFGYFTERYGLSLLPERLTKTISLASPFDYASQGLMLLPSDIPTVQKEDDRAYLEAVVRGCCDAVREANGNTLILFTSHFMLRQVYDKMKEELAGEGYLLLGHGIDSNNRSKLIRKFQRERKTVLLGTNSFWEGVDIPGNALQCVVIVKLPFQPPTHPLYQGKAERMKALDKNPFTHLALPNAVIRFKQGIGRLIRHSADRGVIVVLDSRIVESRYGRVFLQAMPPFQVKTGPWEELRGTIRPFLAGIPEVPVSYT